MARPARRSASPWCGCGAKVTIAQVTREDLVDQHVSRLDPNADLCNEADQIAWGPFAFSSLLLSWRVIALGNVVKWGHTSL
jgi:hypothetical protein